MIKPHKLDLWDILMAISTSRWGPWTFPHRYEAGKKQAEEQFWIKIIEWTYTCESDEFIYDHPKKRAEDLMNAFRNPQIKWIISTIWGEESIRIVPYIDFDVIKNNPKIFMGYSDTTVTNFICYKAWIVSFYGPSVMAGFWENWWLFSYMIESINRTLFTNQIIGEIRPNTEAWTSELLWRHKPENQIIKRKTMPCEGWRWIQWEWTSSWDLLGWCIDVFPFMIGTNIWPSVDERKWKILFLETSEEQMSTLTFERILRNLGSQGILHVIKGIIVGRSIYDYKKNEQINYDEALLKIIWWELWLHHIPIITNMDFGHTDPMFVIPVGCKAIIDCDNKKFIISDNACV